MKSLKDIAWGIRFRASCEDARIAMRRAGARDAMEAKHIRWRIATSMAEIQNVRRAMGARLVGA